MYKRRQVNDYVVYFHLNKKTGDIFYVGIGNERRAYLFHNRNRFWRFYVNKHGFPLVSIVATNLSFEDAAKLEMGYIKTYGRKGVDDNGVLVNISIGGEASARGFRHTKEAKEKISKNHRRTWSEESKLKLSKSLTGKKKSEAHRIKNSLAKKGKNHPNYGKKLPAAFSERLRERNKKMVGDLNGRSRKVINVVTKEIYGSALQVAKRFLPNMHPHAIHAKLNGKVTNNTDYQFLDDYNNGIPKFTCTNNITKPKKVRSLITGAIYNTITEASIINNVSIGLISLHVNNKIINKKFELI